MAQFLNAVGENDHATTIAVFMRTVKHCPSQWGSPDKAKTYWNLPYFDEYLDCVDSISLTTKKVRDKVRFELFSLLIYDTTPQVYWYEIQRQSIVEKTRWTYFYVDSLSVEDVSVYHGFQDGMDEARKAGWKG